MNTFGADAYSDSISDPRSHLANAPATYALRFDLDYVDGGKVALVYPEMPSESELRELTLTLQVAAGRGGLFTVTRVEADGTRLDIPALKVSG